MMIVELSESNSFQHRLIFTDENEAEVAKGVVEKHIKPFDLYIDVDTDECTTYDVWFLTERKLSEIEIANIVQLTQPDTYSLNCNL